MNLRAMSRPRPLLLLLLGSLLLLLAVLATAVVIARQHRLADRAEAAAWVASRHPDVLRLTGQYLAAQPNGDYLLLDVRSAAEWSVSHLPAAFRCEDPGAAVAEARRRHCTRVVVYCSIGERSSQLAERMQALDPNLLIHDLAGGIFTWASEDRPLVDADGQPTRWVHPYDTSWGALLPPDRRAPLP